MPKTKIEDILKKGTKTKVKTIDYNSPKMRRQLIELKKKCEMIERNKNVNWERLANFYITI
jgi:hypothetical protein